MIYTRYHKGYVHVLLLKSIDLLHISDLILKLCFLTHFNMSYFPYDMQNSIYSSKSNWKDKEFEYNFLIICRYLNLVQNQRIIVWQIENSQVVKTWKFWTKHGEIKLFWSNFPWNEAHFPHERETTHKNVHI
jgi:hypothetical protein